MKIVIELKKVTKENLKEPVELFKEVEALAEKYMIVASVDMK